MVAEQPARPTLIYDGDCEFCRATIDRVRRWDRDRRLAVMSSRDAAGGVGAFGVPRVQLDQAIHLVLPDGRVFAGADAAPELLRLLPGKRWLAAVFAVPGVRPLARLVYYWIARRRHCLVRRDALD